MYHGRYQTSGAKTGVPKWRFAVIVVLSVVALSVSIGFTVAHIIASTSELDNSFEAARVACEVSEVFSDGVKSNVKVVNTGDTEVYIRMAVVITWQNSSGHVVALTPQEGTDYTIVWNTAGWIQKDGYWYYTRPVAAGASTPILISQCSPNGDNAPDSCTLSVQLLASAIQSNPVDAVVDAWDVEITDTQIAG